MVKTLGLDSVVYLCAHMCVYVHHRVYLEVRIQSERVMVSYPLCGFWVIFVGGKCFIHRSVLLEPVSLNFTYIFITEMCLVFCIVLEKYLQNSLNQVLCLFVSLLVLISFLHPVEYLHYGCEGRMEESYVS